MELRKEVTAGETIARINALLAKHNIEYEIKSKNIYENICSIRIEIKGLPGQGTNGKGITEDYAMASALGELMERLQSRTVVKSYFGGKSISEFHYSDEFRTMDNEFKYFSDNYELEKLLAEKESIYHIKLPYIDVFSNKTVNIPSRILNMTSGSNGLCSGNSKDEALTQGICEIFERYSSKKIFVDNLMLPEVNRSSVKSTTLIKMLTHIESKGFTYSIKDCSLNNLIPVVGILVLDSSRSSYKFVLGSDPDFEIALQRCITEMFQGCDFRDADETNFVGINWSIGSKPIGEMNVDHTMYVDYLKNYISYSGERPLNFLYSGELVEVPTIFREFTNNKNAYEYMLTILRMQNLEIYIRDYSYLEFPTYRIFIPGLSDIIVPNVSEIKFMSNYKTNINKLINIHKMKKSDLKSFVKSLESLRVNNKYSEFNFGNSLIHLVGDADFDVNYLYLDFFISVIYVHLKYYDRAKERFACFMEYNGMFENGQQDDLLIGLYLYITKLAEGSDIEKISNELKNVVRKETIDYLKNLLDKDNILEIAYMPSCPNCIDCKYKENCSFENWSILNEKLLSLEKKYSEVS